MPSSDKVLGQSTTMDSSAQELRVLSSIVPIQGSTVSEDAEGIWMMLVSAVLKVIKINDFLSQG